MAYIINKEGKRIDVQLEADWITENVTLVDDNARLVDRYLIEIYKKNLYEKVHESEFITEVLLEHEPTDEEILYYMVQNGVSRYNGYATIHKIKVIEWWEED